MKKFLTILLSAFFVFSIMAQETSLSLENAISGRYSYTENIRHNGWQPETNNLCLHKGGSLIFLNGSGGTETEALNLAQLNLALQTKKLKELKAIPSFEWIDRNTLLFSANSSHFVFNLKSKQIESVFEYPENAANFDFNPKQNLLAYTVLNNLHIATPNGNSVPVTTDVNSGIVNGQIVHRNEFGINKGTFWSPDGSKLAFYKKDETFVADYPLVHVDERIAKLENIKYPMAGEKSEEVKLMVYTPATGKTVAVKTGDKSEQFLTNNAWNPESTIIYIAVLNRGQNSMQFNAYNAENGDLIATLFTEENPRYVEPENPALFLPKDPGKFIWQSERDGYNHLYLYDTKGQMLKQLTSGTWIVNEVLGFDAAGFHIYFTATKEDPRNDDMYRIELATGTITRLTEGSGVHSVTLNSATGYFVDNFTNRETPRIVQVMDSEGKPRKKLLEAANPLKDIKTGEVKMITLKSADGKTDLYGRLILPLNFDPKKKYPAIIYVYGGPHAQLVKNTWSVPGWDLFMAQKGYIMLTIDNRGSAGRGFEFESIIHRNLGVAEMADQLKGIEYLKSLGYADMSRIGVHGWSYGGFMTTSLMLNHADIFKVGAAGGPVIDWKFYEVMYGERYMDTPQENPAGYAANSLLTKAGNLKGKLLLIHGDIDNTVVWQHSLLFLKACVKADVIADYYVYPGHEHNVRGKDRINLMRKITQYFDDYL